MTALTGTTRGFTWLTKFHIIRQNVFNKMSDMEASPLPLLDPTFFVKCFF